MIHWNRRRYSKEEFVDAWQSANSIAEALRKIGLSTAAANYDVVKATAKELGLNTDHMLGQASSGDKLRGRQNVPIEVYLSNKRRINGTTLKRKLLSLGLLENRCYNTDCPSPEPMWRGEYLVLQMDHIDGNKYNNNLDNLRILCPNCHTQTETYCANRRTRKIENKFCPDCGIKIAKSSIRCKDCFQHQKAINKKARNTTKDYGKRLLTENCIDCDKKISRNADRCKSCASKFIQKHKEKTDWPEMDELLDKLKGSNYTRVASELGVSDNAIRNRLKVRGIDPKTLSPAN